MVPLLPIMLLKDAKSHLNPTDDDLDDIDDEEEDCLNNFLYDMC